MFIYVIQCYSDEIHCNKETLHLNIHNPFKIGVSANPESRLGEMQTGCPFELELISKVYFKNERQTYAIEKEAHKVFKNYHMRGEWFYGLSVDSVIAYLERKGGKPFGVLTNDECLDIAYMKSIQGVYI